jgi:hypothetical protein
MWKYSWLKFRKYGICAVLAASPLISKIYVFKWFVLHTISGLQVPTVVSVTCVYRERLDSVTHKCHLLVFPVSLWPLELCSYSSLASAIRVLFGSPLVSTKTIQETNFFAFPLFNLDISFLSSKETHLIATIQSRSRCVSLKLKNEISKLKSGKAKILISCIVLYEASDDPNRRPPLWSSGQSSWLQIQRSRVRFPALPDFLRSSGPGTRSTQPCEYNWGATWKK